MPKKRNLNGLPYNLVQQYFSTIFYFGRGYMADWIWCAADEKNVSDIEIDILKKTVNPKSLEINPITAYLDRLQETIKKELVANGFENDFIKSAKFEISISEKDKQKKLFRCVAILKDNDGKMYKSKIHTDTSLRRKFQVF
jgi:hypothetical protein